MTGIDRRTFLGAAGAVALAGRFARSAPASERLRLGVVGVRGRGGELAREFAKRADTEVVALCDIDDAAFTKVAPEVEKIAGKAARTEKDFRRLLDDKEIDAIVNATPDHWHALVAVMACQAGKDVYTEKPASHNVVEGRRMVEAARKYKRVVQMGIQRRSMPHVIDAVKHVQSGGIGTVGMARAWILQKRPAIGPGKPAEVPAGVDYAMWQGPAPDRPFMSQPVPLQLALVLELGDRRAGQQRRPRRQRRPLGARGRRPSGRHLGRRPVRLRRPRGARHPGRHLGVPQGLHRLGAPALRQAPARRPGLRHRLLRRMRAS